MAINRISREQYQAVLDELKPAEKEALETMKKELEGDKLPKYCDEFAMLRFLKAREFKAAKAVAMLRESLAFREEWAVNTLLDTWKPSDMLLKYFPNGWYGEDREGYPIWWESAGNCDVRGLVRIAKREDFIRFRMWQGEHNMRLFGEASAKHKKVLDKTTCVFDLEGLSMKSLYRPFVSIFSELAGIYESNYPETLHKLFILNPPKIFPICFAIIKPFLNETTKSKFVILGNDFDKNAAALREHIDPRWIPKCYGGDAPNPPDIPVSLGGEIPPECYLNDERLENAEEEFVSRGSSFQRKIHVKEAGSIINWTFQTKDNDIGFGLYYMGEVEAEGKTHKKDLEELVESKRFECHLVPESGSFTAARVGVYVARFDNTYSWTKAKTLNFMIEVLDSSGPEEVVVEVVEQPVAATAAAATAAASASPARKSQPLVADI